MVLTFGIAGCVLCFNLLVGLAVLHSRIFWQVLLFHLLFVDRDCKMYWTSSVYMFFFFFYCQLSFYCKISDELLPARTVRGK